MIKSNYPSGFKSGVAIREVPVISLPSKQSNTYWVDANSPFATDNSYQRGTFNTPFATLKYALTQIKPDNGDTIYVAANHIENVSVAAGLEFNKPRVEIIFLGEGDARGTINFVASVASIEITATDVVFINPRFRGAIDALDSPIRVKNNNFKMINGTHQSMGTTDFEDCMVVDGGVKGLIIDGFKYIKGEETGAQKNSFINLGVNCEDIQLFNIDVWGDFAEAPLEFNNVYNIRLENIKLRNTNTTPKPGIEFGTNSTGFAKNIDIRIYSGTNYVSSLALLNWDNNCLGYNLDGSGGERIGGSVFDAGSLIFLTTTLPYTEILAAGHDISTAVVGEFIVEDCVFETGTTGLGTTATIYVGRNSATPTYGAQHWLEQGTVTGQAHASYDIKNATAGIHTTLINGDVIHVAANANATAGSDVKVTIVLRSLIPGSSVEVV